MNDTFLIWSIQEFEGEDKPFYVKLSERNIYKETWYLDYGRFKTYEEAQQYIDTLPDPETAYQEEMKVFEHLQ